MTRAKPRSVSADGAKGLRLPELRIGQGIDIHPLKPGRPCWLGGVRIPSAVGPVGHSDADVLLHALTDALLGAIGGADIGILFSNRDKRWRGMRSARFVREAMRQVKAAGFRVVNADCSVLLEQPRLRPHRAKICKTIADLLKVSPDRIGLKATTTEKLGFVGRGEGILAQVIVLLERPSES